MIRLSLVMRPALPLAIILSACTPEARSAADVEICRSGARATFHRDSEKCATEACINALSDKEVADLGACRK